MARQSHITDPSHATAQLRTVPRMSERETLRRRAAARARATGEFLLTWSIPLIATALVFAAVIVWFWWSA